MPALYPDPLRRPLSEAEPGGTVIIKSGDHRALATVLRTTSAQVVVRSPWNGSELRYWTRNGLGVGHSGRSAWSSPPRVLMPLPGELEQVRLEQRRDQLCIEIERIMTGRLLRRTPATIEQLETLLAALQAVLEAGAPPALSPPPPAPPEG